MTHTTHSLEDLIREFSIYRESPKDELGLKEYNRDTDKISSLIDHYTTTKINEVLDAVEEAIGEDDRDYSQDNADEQSLKVLVATSTACNELRTELRQKLSQIRKEQS